MAGDISHIVEEVRESTLKMCDLFEDREIDYSTFLKHTRIKVKFMRNYLTKTNDIEEVRKTDKVLREHAGIIHYYNQAFIQVAQRG